MEQGTIFIWDSFSAHDLHTMAIFDRSTGRCVAFMKRQQRVGDGRWQFLSNPRIWSPGH